MGRGEANQNFPSVNKNSFLVANCKLLYYISSVIVNHVSNFRISEHFSFYELTGSRDHPTLIELNRRHFSVQPYFERLECGAEYLLEHVRGEVRLPVIVLNGGRCPELNQAVGGVATSQHLFEHECDGAFDFCVMGKLIGDVARVIYDSGLSFYEMRIYPDRNFIHLGMPRQKNNMQMAWIGQNRPKWMG